MLYLVATPIGQSNEISLLALETLKNCQTLIVESTKESSRLLKQHQIQGKKFELLNEHSTAEDKNKLLQICAQENVALLTDCGTPGFCDPGADLVKLCRQQNILVRSVLGASSLMGLLSLSSQRLDEFYFRGFLSADNQIRKEQWKKLTLQKKPIVIMDTPYRLKKTLQEICQYFKNRQILLVMNLSQEAEAQLEGFPEEVLAQLPYEKAEFMLLIYS